MRKVLMILAMLFYFTVLPAQTKNEKPKLVVGIVVDQMRYDLLARYWNKFGDNGFKRLIDNGTYCKSVYYDYLNINSASGCATISCGAYPSQHGIVGKSWYNSMSREEEYCVDDKSVQIIGSKYGSGKSPLRMSAVTWSDQLRISTFKMSKVYSVSFDDYSAILLGGKLANAAYWFDENTGNWITSSYYGNGLKNWVKSFNDKGFDDIYLQKTWNTTYPVEAYKESLSDAASYEKGFNGKHTFPYDLAEIKKGYQNYTLLKYTPYANDLTKDFAINLMMNEYLGKDPYTDVLMINFVATSYIGSIFGLQSVELEDAYIKLDKDIAHLIRAVESYAGKENVVFFLTSDRGSCDNTQWLNDINISTTVFNPTRATVVISSYLRAVYGTHDWIDGFYDYAFYFNHFEIDKAKLSVTEFQQKAADILVNMQGVSAVIPTSELVKGSYSSGLMHQARNSYYRGRSGDIFIVLDYGSRFKANTEDLCTCSSAFNENTHIPLIFYGAGIKKQKVYRRISMDDLAVTLSYLLDIPLPNKSTGMPIVEVFE